MLKNFITVAIRNIRKNKLYSFVNISGLSVGIACSILIMLWVVDELSFDKQFPKAERLYQVLISSDFDGKTNTWRSVPLPTYEEMKVVNSSIVNAAVTDWGYERLLQYGDKRIYKDGYWVSKEFLSMFEQEFIYGDGSTAFEDPTSIIITESTAFALFGDEDPMDKVIRVDNESELKVTGVVKDVKNSSFQFDVLVPWAHRAAINEWVRDNQDNWGNSSFQVFVELDDPTNKDAVDASIKDMITEHQPDDDIVKDLFLYPMPRWHLYGQFENGVETGGMNEYVQLFSIIAFFILVIACINFMNLATARSEKRLKEVGIRKSIGSRRIDLIFQFMGESMVISTIAFATAILIVLLVLPGYNVMVDKTLSIDIGSSLFWIVSGSLILFTGLLGGSYPAFYLSSFSPARTLKGTIVAGKNASLPRQILVVLQFGVAIVLIVGTIIIYQQIQMAQNRDLGYNQNKLISFVYTDEIRENYGPLKTELLQSGAVEAVTRSNSPITGVYSNNFLGWPGKPEELQVMFSTLTIHYDYAKTMGVNVLMGRDFDEHMASDSAAIIINKTAFDLMELEDPIGEQLDLWGQPRTLIGVVDDVIMESVYREVKPMFMIIDDWGGWVTVRLNQDRNVQESLATVEGIYKKHNPAYPFDYDFADVEYQEKFTTIRLTSKLAIIFAGLAILITGLGLFGLASYTAEQRTKEIGIRKVLGASVNSLIQLMSRDFSLLVIIAFVLASPVAWVLLDNYLERYPLRIDMQVWIFPVAGIVALVFAILIVSNQARRAAVANPVDSLRNE